eukprot:430816_1
MCQNINPNITYDDIITKHSQQNPSSVPDGTPSPLRNFYLPPLHHPLDEKISIYSQKKRNRLTSEPYTINDLKVDSHVPQLKHQIPHSYSALPIITSIPEPDLHFQLSSHDFLLSPTSVLRDKSPQSQQLIQSSLQPTPRAWLFSPQPIPKYSPQQLIKSVQPGLTLFSYPTDTDITVDKEPLITTTHQFKQTTKSVRKKAFTKNLIIYSFCFICIGIIAIKNKIIEWTLQRQLIDNIFADLENMFYFLSKKK